MLILNDVSYTYPTSHSEVLHGISLEINPGERVLVSGRNGSGKSTLLHLISGILAPSDGTISSSYTEQSIPTGLLQQHPENQIIASTVEDEIAFGLENINTPVSDIRMKIEETLALLGMAGFEKRSPARLSGGEMQKLAFACLYTLNPPVWLMDEPTAYLDPVAKQQLFKLMEHIPDEHIILWTASSTIEKRPFTRMISLEDGKIANDITIDSEHTETPIDLENVSFEKHKPPPQKISNDLSTVFLSVSGLTVERKELFGTSKRILKDVNLALNRGEILGVIGSSGSGKTTLLEALAGLVPFSGKVAWNGEAPTTLHGKIGVAFQFPERSFFAETVLDEVMYGILNQGEKKDVARKQALAALEEVGLPADDFASRNPFELSGGQARRVALAVLLALQPIGLLLDEPTAGLDEEGCQLLGEIISRKNRSGCPTIIAGHDIQNLIHWVNRWVFLEKGIIAVEGDTEMMMHYFEQGRLEDHKVWYDTFRQALRS
ncbi:energy-coupling factor ABC transporter ATP-binding protein [bacterium]|nr:energy-coupling factor ABC transporter ATP-binding protein [bacterium]